MGKVYLQITSGRGPTECCRVVAEVLKMILAEAKKNGFETEVVEKEDGVVSHTLFSAVILLQGENLDEFVSAWEGSILWITQSPYRKFHKRKNWFIGVQRLKIPEISEWDESEFSFQTLRASGPGGQHVNKTESAVRVTHLPSGISVVVSDNRSQLQNKRLATERLLLKLSIKNQETINTTIQDNWQNHNTLQRGNPIKTFKKELK